MPELLVVGVRLPEVAAGDDLARLVLAGCADAGVALAGGDVLVVSSKVVSKALGLTAASGSRDEVVVQQTRRVVAARRTPRGTAVVVESVAGPVMAAAGVDASNTAPGTVLVLPPDPDAVARTLRARLRELGTPVVGVVVSDTAGRAWRVGQTDFALGCAGLAPVQDLRGTTDAGGQPLEVTERAVADAVAAAADLVKGKADGVPVAVVRGLADFVTGDDGPGAAELLRDSGSDWFRFGHVEAARAALGVQPADVEPASVLPEALGYKVFRAVEVAQRGEPAGPEVVLHEDRVVLRGDAFTCGRLAARLQVALWAEGLAGAVADPGYRDGGVTVLVTEPGDVTG